MINKIYLYLYYVFHHVAYFIIDTIYKRVFKNLFLKHTCVYIKLRIIIYRLPCIHVNHSVHIRIYNIYILTYNIYIHLYKYICFFQSYIFVHTYKVIIIKISIHPLHNLSIWIHIYIHIYIYRFCICYIECPCI